jgi:cytochrome c oxidase subunit 2
MARAAGTRLADRAGMVSVLWSLLTLLGPAPQAGDAPQRAFEITASKFKFEPALIEVSEGDRVKLTLRSADGTHGFGIKSLNLRARIPKGGAPVTLEFVAARAGSYDFVCTEYCGSGHKTMKGRLVVSPSAK